MVNCQLFILFFFYIILGLLPSLVWLSYYLRKDVHPEPKGMILKVFFGGAIIALAAAVIESGSYILFKKTVPDEAISNLLFMFLGVALVEEYLKYFVVKTKVIKSPEFDEPVDAMIYLIIAALGFAAAENVLLLTSPVLTNFLTEVFPGVESQKVFNINQALGITLVRFWGATFLHALASGIMGFFLAFSFYHRSRFKFAMISTGLILATLLHGLFNWFIILIEKSFVFVFYVMVLLISAALVVAFFFRRLKSKRVIREINLGE